MNFGKGFPGIAFPTRERCSSGAGAAMSPCPEDARRRQSKGLRPAPVLYLNHDMARTSCGIYVFLNAPSYIRSKCVYGWIYETQLKTYRKGLSPRRNEILINWRIHCYIGKIKGELLSNHVSVLRWAWKILWKSQYTCDYKEFCKSLAYLNPEFSHA